MHEEFASSYTIYISSSSENNGIVNASIKAHTERTFGKITMMLMMVLKYFSTFFFLHRN